MAFGKITPKQQEILDYIKQEILNKGYPPTVREICETVNLKSTSSVHLTWKPWKRTVTSAETLQNPVQSKFVTIIFRCSAGKW